MGGRSSQKCYHAFGSSNKSPTCYAPVYGLPKMLPTAIVYLFHLAIGYLYILYTLSLRKLSTLNMHVTLEACRVLHAVTAGVDAATLD